MYIGLKCTRDKLLLLPEVLRHHYCVRLETMHTFDHCISIR